MDDIDFEIDKEIRADDQRVADVCVASSLVATSARMQGGLASVPCLIVPPERGSHRWMLMEKSYRSIGWRLVEQKEDRFFLAPLHE